MKSIETVGGAALSAETRSRVDCHPLGVVAHVFTSIAVTVCVVAAGLMVVGAVLHSDPTFAAGAVVLLAGITLELRSQTLAHRALSAISDDER